MRLATYNVENLFERPIAFAGPGKPSSQPAEEAVENCAKLTKLFDKPDYEEQDKVEMLKLMEKLDLLGSNECGPYAILRRNHGRLTKRTGHDVQIVAKGRGSWSGWVELKRSFFEADEPVENTARVIADCKADVQAVVEIEGRRELRDFADMSIKPLDKEGFQHVMEIDGKDDRGISVGLLTRHDWDITDIHTHVDDVDDIGPIFSRDCAQYTLSNGSGAEFVVLVNHFKSQRNDGGESEAKRERQAKRVAQIYQGLREEGREVAIVGDFNITEDSPSLAPLLSLKPDLREISECDNFDDGTAEGTAGGGGPLLGTYGEAGKEKLDYILLSKGLFDKLEGAGIYRKGVWHTHKPRGKTWEMYKTMEPEPGLDGDGSQNAASDHALVYADLDI